MSANAPDVPSTALVASLQQQLAEARAEAQQAKLEAEAHFQVGLPVLPLIFRFIRDCVMCVLACMYANVFIYCQTLLQERAHHLGAAVTTSVSAPLNSALTPDTDDLTLALTLARADAQRSHTALALCEQALETEKHALRNQFAVFDARIKVRPVCG
jgi:hypothetical protein